MEDLELMELYRGNNKKNIPPGKDSIEFAKYLLSFPNDKFPIKLIDLFRIFKESQKN